MVKKLSHLFVIRPPVPPDPAAAMDTVDGVFHASDESDSEDRDNSSSDEVMEVPDDGTEDITDESSINDTTDAREEADDGFQHIEKVVSDASDKLIQFLTNCCLTRIDNSAFERELTFIDEEIVHSARQLWKHQKLARSSVFVCNSCGIVTQKGKKCCGDIAKFVRVGCRSQLLGLIRSQMSEILLLREKLHKNETEHNLSAPFFDRLWKSEDFAKNQLSLSLLLSIDGVVVKGNTNKIWPVSFELLDLPVSEMQKSTNIILEGIVESRTTPSTALWNAILPYIVSDVKNSSAKIGKFDCNMRIVTVAADQPIGGRLAGPSTQDLILRIIVTGLVQSTEKSMRFSQSTTPQSITRMMIECFHNISDRMRKKHNTQYEDKTDRVAAKLKILLESGTDDRKLDFTGLDSKLLKNFLSA